MNDAERLLEAYYFVKEPKLLLSVLHEIKKNVSEEFPEKEEIRELLQMKKECPVEFTRDGEIILCSGEYNCKKIDEAFVKSMLEKAKVFIDETSTKSSVENE